MNDNAPLDVDEQDDEDDVPDWVEECDHIDCNDESVERSRLCERCVKIMTVSAPDECPYCGTTFNQ